MLWSGSDDKTIKVWNISTGESIKTIQTTSEVKCLVQWRETIISGGGNTDIYLCVWSRDGEALDKWKLEGGGKINTTQTVLLVVLLIVTQQSVQTHL